MGMKYSLSQYVHDGYRLKALQAEIWQLQGYKVNHQWIGERMREIAAEQAILSERMYKFERHPNNR